ncbi:MAG TPA: glycosyltransferase [Candidatus Limnocylindria bacterium]
MRRLRILTWHVHGSYLDALTRIDHEWLLPLKPGRPESYGGRAGRDLPPNAIEVPADQVRDRDVDLVLYQATRNWTEDQDEILSDDQRRLPRIFLEHNTPRPHPTDSKHVVDDPNVLLVHVTHFNRLMWDNGRTPTTVIEHSVSVDPRLEASGDIAGGISVVNELGRRGRLAGEDVFLAVRDRVPVVLAGMGSERYGGLGDLPYLALHREVARRRFYFNPIRYTSLPLAVIEAMTIGLPIVALATTELPTAIEDGVTGYVSCDVDALVERMRELIASPDDARRMGRNARRVALQRFGLARFARDWNAAFSRVTGIPSEELAGLRDDLRVVRTERQEGSDGSGTAATSICARQWRDGRADEQGGEP